MSSSSRNRARAARAATTGGLALAAAAAGSSADAAQIYYQPIVSLGSGYNTNVNLDPLNKESAVGYFADAAVNLGIATSRSEWTLQPRLTYNYYPSVQERNRLEAFLNSYTRYSWERDRFTMVGFFDHRDDVNAEQPGAEDNPVNPGVGNTPPGTGHPALGITRNYVLLDPTFVHLLTPLSSIGFAGDFQRMDYSTPDTSSHVPFNYYQGRLFFAKTIDQRTDVAIGAFGSHYEAGTIDSHSNSGGVQLDGGYNWSPVLRSNLTAQYQRIKFEENGTRQIDVTNNAWSATFNTTYKQQISSYHFSIGRSLYPSSAGGLYRTDQVRGQYDRELTQRVELMAAVRYFRQRTTVGALGDDQRNYATSTVRLQYMLTPTLFVAGSYTYIYQKYHFDPASADSNNFFINFGYRGLERQQR